MFIVSTFCQFVNVNYLFECFLGGSGGMEVDITWILLFARMFLGGFLDVWMWISPNEKRERPPVPCCSP